MGLRRLDPYRLLLDERVVIYLSQKLERTLEDEALEQLRHGLTVPGVIGVCAMPDIHTGFGLPIGGVMAVRAEGGAVSPAAVGVDINCGVQLIATDIEIGAVAKEEDRRRLFTRCVLEVIPAGEGKRGHLRFGGDPDSRRRFERILTDGVGALEEEGLVPRGISDRIEEGGAIPGADPAALPEEAYEIGREQLGSLGSGNHFVELQAVDEVFRPDLAEAWGIAPGYLHIMIHSGSRRLGNITGMHYASKIAPAVMRREKISAELGVLPIDSPEGQRYLAAMTAAANWAFANRALMAERIREALSRELGREVEFRLVYDVAHNIAKFERHIVEGKEVLALVHRKGATRALGPGHPALPEAYRAVGQPVLIGGTMGTASYILVGTQEGEARSLSSSCHGAGRALSRHQALKQWHGKEVVRELAQRGIIVRSPSPRGVAEEAPGAYKDVSAVVDAAHAAGLSRKVARLEPLICIKG